MNLHSNSNPFEPSESTIAPEVKSRRVIHSHLVLSIQPNNPHKLTPSIPATINPPTVGFRIPPFIATLGMMMIASGLAFMISQGQSIDRVPSSFVWLGRSRWLGIPLAVWLMLGIFAIGHGVMVLTTYGRSVYAIGGNEVAARLCGVRVGWITASVYGVSGLLAGLGGLVMASRLGTGDAKYGAMVELSVIAAVVVGGTSLRGGYGTMFGTLIGALIIAVIENGMNLMQLDSYAQKVVFGGIILFAVLIDRLRHKA